VEVEAVEAVEALSHCFVFKGKRGKTLVKGQERWKGKDRAGASTASTPST
jgi:hypothetical protein